MKVNTFKKIEEGFFSDLVNASSSRTEYDKDKISDKAKPLFIKDFIADFTADLQKYIDANQITLPESAERFTYAELDILIENIITEATRNPLDLITSAVTRNMNDPKSKIKIKSPADVGVFIATKYPNIWKNTTDKPGVIKYIWDNTKQSVQPASKQADSISQWVPSWFTAYMKGVDWDQYSDEITTIAKEIEKSYQTDKGKAGIAKLAELSWNVVNKSNTVPYGASNVFAGNTSQLSPDDKKLLTRLMGAMEDPNFSKDLTTLMSRYKK